MGAYDNLIINLWLFVCKCVYVWVSVHARIWLREGFIFFNKEKNFIPKLDVFMVAAPVNWGFYT